MSDNPTNIDQTITLLKIQGLLASAYELSLHTEGATPNTDSKFLSYLIKMARMEVSACFDKINPSQADTEKRDNLDRM